MSLLSKIGKGLRGLVKTVAPAIAPMLPGPAGAIAGAILGQKSVGQLPTAPVPYASSFGPAVLPAVGAIGRAVLPSLGAGLAGGVAMRGIGLARTAARSAMTYCRRHPGWCASIGGLAAVEALVGNGSLPPIKHRRRKGISAGDLQKFRRVAGFLHQWGPMCAGGARAPRKRSCR